MQPLTRVGAKVSYRGEQFECAGFVDVQPGFRDKVLWALVNSSLVQKGRQVRSKLGKRVRRCLEPSRRRPSSRASERSDGSRVTACWFCGQECFCGFYGSSFKW